MLRRSIVRLVLLPSLVALALVGCSGTDAVDKQGYIKENNKIQTRVGENLNALDPSKPADIDTAISELDDAITDFKALDVPADYKEEHADLVESIEELRDVLKDLKTAAAKQDASAVTGLMSRMSAAQTKYQAAITAMNADLA